MGILTQIWEAIPVYMGLSSVTFVTLVALLVAGYYLLSSLFAPPPFKGNIYDVSQSRGFDGPGGAYSLFAGKDASRALAKMSFEKEDLTGDISGLSAYELSALDDWEYKFQSKYHKVGELPKWEVGPKEEASSAQEVPKPLAEAKLYSQQD
ncbi:unnamed protein product [Calypogeia fissa]